MLITRVSQLTGKEHTLEVPANPDDLRRWERGELLIQEAMPYLAPHEREYLMSGITQEEWLACFGTGDHDDDPEPSEAAMRVIASTRVPKGGAS
jgi:hypothetical protein